MSETSATRISEIEIDLVPWWLVLLEGLAALIIGIYLFISPAPTVIILVAILGWYWLITGILTLITLIMDRTNATWRALSAIGNRGGDSHHRPSALERSNRSRHSRRYSWSRRLLRIHQPLLGAQRRMGCSRHGRSQHHLRPSADRLSHDRHRYAGLPARRFGVVGGLASIYLA